MTKIYGLCFVILTLNVWGPSYLGLTRSIYWLLMPWLLTSPGHQQPWYWLYRICRSFPYLREDFKYQCQINVEEWHKMLKYMFMFPLKNLARKGLKSDLCSPLVGAALHSILRCTGLFYNGTYMDVDCSLKNIDILSFRGIFDEVDFLIFLCYSTIVYTCLLGKFWTKYCSTMKIN